MRKTTIRQSAKRSIFFMKESIQKTEFKNLNLIGRGKVRDIYSVKNYLLIVTTDRISAFDVIMPNPVPGKGIILNRLSAFWFEKMKDIIGNHIVSVNPAEYPEECAPYRKDLEGRSMLVKKASPLPVECIVRGYLSGSGWKDYQRNKTVSGIKLPEGLKESCKLPEPIFTPTTKAEVGEHDAPINRKEMEDIIGEEITDKVIKISMAVYQRAAEIALKAGIIIADTKMEFGLIGKELILIDELLTPDSSRFWPADDYQEGRAQKSFDKQFLRDYLLSIKWNQNPPAPELPPEIIENTKKIYEEALKRLAG
jgi:phosphoribosylaminoimidazole-succinocarboxamide synthase